MTSEGNIGRCTFDIIFFASFILLQAKFLEKKQNYLDRTENIFFLCLLEKTIIIEVSITQHSETDERAEMLLV